MDRELYQIIQQLTDLAAENADMKVRIEAVVKACRAAQIELAEYRARAGNFLAESPADAVIKSCDILDILGYSNSGEAVAIMEEARAKDEQTT